MVAFPLPRRARALARLAPAALALAACAPRGAETDGAAPADRAPAAAAAAAAPELPLKHAPRPTVSDITEGDLMTRIYAFADDSMQGRDAGLPSNDRGNAYIERELRRLGLQPAGDGGTYFQTIPLVRRGADTTSTLSAGGRPLAYGTEFLPANARGTLRPMAGRALPVVYGGALGAPFALTREQVAGKVVLLAMPDPFRAVLRIQPDEPLAAAAGVLVTALERMPAAARRVHVTPGVGLAAASSGTAPVPLQVFVTTATAERIAGGPLAGRAPGTPGALAVDARVAFGETPAPARNVVAVLPGRDPAARGQYVAVGAHNDHIGIAAPPVDHDSLKAFNAAERRAHLALDADGDEVLTAGQSETLRGRVAAIRVNVDSLRRLRPARPDSIANGADDDGSGSMALLEMAEQLAAGPRPRRSVLFVWHTAEEKGLLGARYFADRPTVPRDSIVAQVNIDMIGRGRAGDQAKGGDDYVGVVGARRLSTELGDLAERVNAAQARPLRFDYALDANGHPLNIYCRSDHFHYARYGVPIVFLFTGLHGDYHQVTDEPQYLDYPHYARIVRYARDLVVRVADLDHRVVVDKPKPDPNGSCRQ